MSDWEFFADQRIVSEVVTHFSLHSVLVSV